MEVDEEAAAQIRQRLIDTMREIPGVDASALGFGRPFEGGLPINASPTISTPFPC